MRFKRTLALAVFFVEAALGQTPADELRSRLASVHYPALAEAARLQGDVHLRINSGVVTLISGPPLLVQTAVESAKTVGSILGGGDFDATYHFVVSGAPPAWSGRSLLREEARSEGPS